MTQQEFLDKYGIKTTFEEMSKATSYLKFTGDMLSSGTGKSAGLMMYKQGLDFMFTKFIDSHIDLKEFGSNSKLWNLDLRQFAKDFENVMTNDPLERDFGRKRKPYEGAELEVIDSLKAIAEKYNEEPKDVLASRIKSGMDLGALRKSALIDLNKVDSDEKMENAKNVSTMYLAMKKVIGERTWKDRINPLNWGRMINESIFMLQINSRMKDVTREELKSDPLKVGSGRGSGNFEKAMNTYASLRAYSSVIIDQNTITDLENYRNERAEEKQYEVDLETTITEKIPFTVDELSPDLDNTIEIQERYEDEPSKNLNKSFDSM